MVLLCSVTQVSFAQSKKFQSSYKQFLERYSRLGLINYRQIEKQDLTELSEALEQVDINENQLHSNVHFWINAYNFIVIRSITEKAEIKSVQEDPNFFKKGHRIGNIRFSLDALEKKLIEKTAKPGIHLLLNCGAFSCFPIQYFDQNIAIDTYVRSAIKNEKLASIDTSQKSLELSRIFYWHSEDFKDGVMPWVEEMIEASLDDYTIKYMEFDWRINNLSADEYLIFYPTKLYRKGGGEIKVFNNYYTQTENGIRSNFLSNFFQVLIGTDKNINWGVDLKTRSANQGDVGLFSALKYQTRSFYESGGIRSFSRSGISAFGPRIKYQPFKSNAGINFLHSVYFTTGGELEANDDFGFFDFSHIQIFNNVYIEKEISIDKRLFYDLGLWVENIDLAPGNAAHTMQIQVPVTGIYSYFPNPKTTIYLLGNLTMRPVYRRSESGISDWDLGGYGQLGSGFKYYVFDNMELEVLYTYFYDGTPGRQAHTFNFGLRVFKF